MATKKNETEYSVVIPVSMNRYLAGIIDVWAKEIHRNRSDFIREACRYYIKKLVREEAK